MNVLINEAIKNLRNELHLNKAELAVLVGVTRGMVHNYETGRRKPSLRVVRKMFELAKANKIKLLIEDFLN